MLGDDGPLELVRAQEVSIFNTRSEGILSVPSLYVF